MRRYRIRILYIVPFFFELFCSSVSLAEFRYEEYKTTTLAKEIHDYPHDPSADSWIEGANLKYCVRVEYLNKQRSISSSLSKFLDGWATSRGQNEIRSLFQEEILVREGNSEYWLPIQKQLVKPLIQEVQPGSRVDLYVVRIGSIKSGPIFIINEFNVIKK